jgi:hypothetical protein
VGVGRARVPVLELELEAPAVQREAQQGPAVVNRLLHPRQPDKVRAAARVRLIPVPR